MRGQRTLAFAAHICRTFGLQGPVRAVVVRTRSGWDGSAAWAGLSAGERTPWLDPAMTFSFVVTGADCGVVAVPGLGMFDCEREVELAGAAGAVETVVMRDAADCLPWWQRWQGWGRRQAYGQDGLVEVDGACSVAEDER